MKTLVNLGSFRDATSQFVPFACIALVTFSLLVFQAGGLYRFVWAKVIVLALAVILGLLSGRGGLIPRPLWLVISGMSVWLLLAATLSDDPWASLAGRWPRYEGFPVFAVYLGLFAVGARMLAGPLSTSRWMLFRKCLSVVSLVLLGLSALEAAGLRPLGGSLDSRPGATLGNATDQGLIGVLLCGLLLAPVESDSVAAKWLIRVGRAASVLTVLLSGSRAALLGLALLFMFALMWRVRAADGRAWTVIGKGLLAIAAVIGVAALVPGIRERLLSGETVAGRWLLWEQTVRLISDHFWFGVGPSGFVDAFPAYLSERWTREVGNDFPADSPHMWFLQAAVAGGVPFLILALLACSVGFALCIRGIRSVEDQAQQRTLLCALFALVASGAGMLTHFTSPGTTGLMAFVAGGILGASNAHSPERHARVSPRLSGAGRGALRAGAIALFVPVLAVGILAAAAEWPMKTGVQFAAEGRMDAANDSFESAYALRPWDADTALLAAQAFAGPAADGDPLAASYAIRWAETSLERTPSSLEGGLVLAIGQVNSGDLLAAKSRLDGLIRRAPFDDAPYIQRGIANFGLGDIDASLADLQRAAELAPTSDAPWSILARIYTRLGDETAAATAQARADALKP